MYLKRKAREAIGFAVFQDFCEQRDVEWHEQFFIAHDIHYHCPANSNNETNNLKKANLKFIEKLFCEAKVKRGFIQI